MLCIGAGVAYIAGFVVLYDLFHNDIAAAALLPVAIAGLLLGKRVGLLAGVLAFPLNTLLLNSVGEAGWDAVFRVGGGPSMVLIVLAGVGCGWLRELHVRLDTEIARRKDAEVALRDGQDRLHGMTQTNRQERTRTEQALRRRAEELQALHATLLDIAQINDLDTLLEAIATRAAQLLDAPRSGLYLYDESGQGTGTRVFGFNLPPHYPHVIIKHKKETAELQTKSDGNLSSQNAPLRPTPHRATFIAVLGAPMLCYGKTVGMINVMREEAPFSQQELELLSLFADQAAIVIEKTYLVAAERRRAEEAEALRAANVALTQRLDLDAVLDTLLEHLYVLVPYDSATVLLRSPGTSRVAVRALRGYESWTDPELTRGVTFDAETYPHFRRMVTTQESLIIDDTRTYDGWIEVPGTEHVRNWLGVPLVAGGEVIGFYGLDKTELGFFTADHRRLAEMLAAQAAIAIKNAQLFEMERQRRSALEQLRRVSLQLTSTLTLAPVLDTVLDAILALTSYKNAHIFVYDGETLTFGAAVLEGERRDAPIAEPRPDGLTYTVARTGETVVIPSVDEHHLFQDWQWGGAIAALPLRIGEEVVGVINVAYYTPQTFDDHELQVLRLLADKAAVAIHNARLFEQTETTLARTEALYAIARSLITLERSTDVLEVVVDRAADALAADRVLLIVIDQSAHAVTRFVAGGPGGNDELQPSYEELMNGLTGWALRTREPVLSPKETTPDPRESQVVQQHREATDAGAVCVVPLRYRDTIFGTMTAINRTNQRNFDQDDLSLLEAIASQAAIALENMRLFAEIERLATTDELTGLHNRRHCFELAERECARAQRTGRPIAAIMLDVDRFKQINDSYGHKVGDEVLQTVARNIATQVRTEDILGRYGGEEFVVILPETDPAMARKIAKRLLESIRDKPIATTRGPINVTMSIGVAVADAPPDPMTLVDQADAALYAAKRAGRNRVMMNEESTTAISNVDR